MSLWILWWNAIRSLRPAFTRLQTFLWFATAVAGCGANALAMLEASVGEHRCRFAFPLLAGGAHGAFGTPFAIAAGGLGLPPETLGTSEGLRSARTRRTNSATSCPPCCTFRPD
jgi:hypothetical protein